MRWRLSVNMANTEPITIIWKEYSKVLRAGIWSLFKEQLLVDVSLTRDQSEGHKEGFKVHRFILAVFFNGLKDSVLQLNETQEEIKSQSVNGNHHHLKDQDLIHLNLQLKKDQDHQDQDVLKVLMEFAYSGTVTVPRHSLENVLLAAQQLGFEGLVSSIKEHNINSSNFEETDENDPDDSRNPIAGDSYENDHEYYKRIDTEQCDSVTVLPNAADQLQLKVSKVRMSRKGIPIKLRKPIGRQCKVSSESSAMTKNIVKVKDNDEEETMSIRKEKRQRKRRKRKKCDESDSDDEESEEDRDDYNGIEDEESSKDEEDENWKTSTVTTAPKVTHTNRTKSGGRKPRRKRSRAIFACDRCDYTTSDKSTYSNHLAKHDPSVEVQNFTCEFCSKVFKSKKGYRCHMKTHGDPELQFKCDHCPYTTPQKWSWRQHLAVMHKVDESGNPIADNIACDQCDFTCVALHQLKAHLLRKHTLDKPFKCQQCDYSTITRSELETHVGVQHRKERHYMCETCGFRSQTQSGLKRHYRSHLGIKPFKCEQCGMEYADRGKYKGHLQRHTSDEKPFICHICGHSCRRRDNLQMHLRRIHRVSLDRENVTGSGSCIRTETDNTIPTEEELI